MSSKVRGTSISFTRGDTFIAVIGVTALNPETGEEEAYTPMADDRIRFAMKKTYDDNEPLLLNIDIPLDSLELVIHPADTKKLKYGRYVYDVQLTTAEGIVTTFIQGTITLTEEVE